MLKSGKYNLEVQDDAILLDPMDLDLDCRIENCEEFLQVVEKLGGGLYNDLNAELFIAREMLLAEWARHITNILDISLQEFLENRESYRNFEYDPEASSFLNAREFSELQDIFYDEVEKELTKFLVNLDYGFILINYSTGDEKATYETEVYVGERLSKAKKTLIASGTFPRVYHYVYSGKEHWILTKFEDWIEENMKTYSGSEFDWE